MKLDRNRIGPVVYHRACLERSYLFSAMTAKRGAERVARTSCELHAKELRPANFQIKPRTFARPGKEVRPFSSVVNAPCIVMGLTPCKGLSDW